MKKKGFEAQVLDALKRMADEMSKLADKFQKLTEQIELSRKAGRF